MSDKKKLPPGALSPLAADVLNAAANNPNFAALSQYLQTRGRLPSVDTSPYLGGADGQYKGGKITLRQGLSPSTATGILTHEMVHAADEGMSGQFLQRTGEVGNAPGQNQFVDAYRKLYRDPANPKSNPRVEGAAALAPEWMRQNQGYRTTINELPAWAVGNFSGQEGQWNAPPHVDASAASDFMVLLELAQRDAAKAQAPAPGVLERLRSLFSK